MGIKEEAVDLKWKPIHIQIQVIISDVDVLKTFCYNLGSVEKHITFSHHKGLLEVSGFTLPCLDSDMLVTAVNWDEIVKGVKFEKLVHSAGCVGAVVKEVVVLVDVCLIGG
ncbi:hypothetical protein SUGI_0580620 [Cryptomeria japonica]|nr:hypothetical protein SUGI_0580620 [Cryptomeria japonica]